MKVLLKFLLLFSLIIVGKLVKEPAVADVAIKPAVSELPVHMVSFFSLQGPASGHSKQEWLRQSTPVSHN